MVADEAGVTVVGVGHQQRAHASTVRGRMAVPQISSPTSRRPRLAGHGVVKHTPVTTSAAISDRVGGRVVLKAENLQRTGSFKVRGAMSKVAALGARAAQRGHRRERRQPRAGAGLRRPPGRRARARSSCPPGAPISKIEACLNYGAIVVEGGESLDEAVLGARLRAEEAGMEFCHPYDDLAVIAGQATLGRELLDDVPDLRRLVVPLGGGGLASGVAIALKRHDPSIQVVGVQAAACAPYANQPTSLGAGRHAGRRHRREATGRDHPPARSSSGSTTSSWSTRRPSPTRWCC